MTPPEYGTEPVDRLPFGSEEKSQRYATERYRGAEGLNWYQADPALRAVLQRRLTPEELAWAEPRLDHLGALCGGPITRRADETDRNPPRLERYDRWGHDVSRVVIPESVLATRRDLYDAGFERPDVLRDAQASGLRTTHFVAASQYLLDQADIGMMCALGTGGEMVARLVAEYAPPDVRDHVTSRFTSGEWWGSTAQLLTERTGGSDLAQIETTATRAGDAWLLNGFKWFASNADGQAWVVLAKPEGAPDGLRGVCSFLVLRERRDGSRNGIRIRRLKDKLGTKAVASAEVELCDAEAFLLAPTPTDAEGRAGDGRGLSRMMELTNGARLGIAMMGLGCARRAFVEAACYARTRPAFGAPLADHPLMRRKLVEMAGDVQAAMALVFDGYSMSSSTGHPDPAAAERGSPPAPPGSGGRLRLGAPLAKLMAARLGVTAASDAVEIHGGNGYVETWPVARILRDAQVNTIWEGADNILCLDVRRAIEREEAHLPLLERIEKAASSASGHPGAEPLSGVIAQTEAAVGAWIRLNSTDRPTAEARLFPLSQLLSRVYAAALLWEQAAWEAETLGETARLAVADLWTRRRILDRGPLGELEDTDPVELNRFDDLMDATLLGARGA
ncbi:MAG TPA: acyl-CoA dehydrogenase family protein [Acidimicrobiales bacterium]|nr:acyl-CoA dehydrogenase family protein [Acidimicrobiales bacterium]